MDGSPQVFSWRYARRDGSQFVAEVLLKAVDPSGIAHVQGIIRCIENGRPNMDEHGKNYDYVHILQALPEEELDGIVLITRDLRIAWASDSTLNVFREKATGFIGRHCFQYRHRRTEPCEQCLVLKCFTSGKREFAEYRN